MTHWLELRPERRVSLFYMIGGLLMLSLPATFIIAGWSDEPGSTVILLVFAAAFGLLTVHGVTQRVRFGDRKVARRIFGVWTSRQLPRSTVFAEYDDPNPYGGLVRTWLRLPKDIVATEAGTGRKVLTVRPELLGAYQGDDYRDLLANLNRRYGAGQSPRHLTTG